MKWLWLLVAPLVAPLVEWFRRPSLMPVKIHEGPSPYAVFTCPRCHTIGQIADAAPIAHLRAGKWLGATCSRCGRKLAVVRGANRAARRGAR